VFIFSKKSPNKPDQSPIVTSLMVISLISHRVYKVVLEVAMYL